MNNTTHGPVLDSTIALVSTYFILVTVVGVLLNLLTIFALAFGSNISKEVHIQLINLAAADLIMAAFFPTSMMTDNILFFPFRGTRIWCGICFCISVSSSHASLLCNAAISLERVIVVYFPFRAAGYTKTKKILVVGFIWISATITQIVTARYSELMVDNGNTYCEIGFVRTLLHYQWIEALQSIIPTVVIIVSYCLVFAKLGIRKKSNIVTNHLSSSNSHAIDKVSFSQKALLSSIVL